MAAHGPTYVHSSLRPITLPAYPQEDAALNQIVAGKKAALRSGVDIWPDVAAALAVGRTAKQCRERYHHHLQPDVNKGSWTTGEERLLFHMQATIGEGWWRRRRWAVCYLAGT